MTSSSKEGKDGGQVRRLMRRVIKGGKKSTVASEGVTPPQPVAAQPVAAQPARGDNKRLPADAGSASPRLMKRDSSSLKDLLARTGRQSSHTFSLVSSVSQGANFCDFLELLQSKGPSHATEATTSAREDKTLSATPSIAEPNMLMPEKQIVPPRRVSRDISQMLTAVESGKLQLPLQICVQIPQKPTPLGLTLRGVRFHRKLDGPDGAPTPDKKLDGIYVRRVLPGSLAEVAGLQRGDRIATINSGPVYGPTDRTELLKRVQTLSQYMHTKTDARERVLHVQVLRRAPVHVDGTVRADETGYTGLHVTATHDGRFLIDKVDAESPAGRLGLAQGMEIVAVDGMPVAHADCVVRNGTSSAALSALLSLGAPVRLHAVHAELACALGALSLDSSA